MIRVGAILAGKYKLLSELGSGAMGTVFRAEHMALGKLVAVKVLLGELADGAEYRARFEREARVCAKLRHPGVVGVHDVGSDGNNPYLVMDLLSGFTLRELLDSAHKLSVDRSLRIAAQLADALIAAHEARLVHRDLKPENIMLEEGERPVIVDFGLAFIDSALSNTGRMTDHGIIMGTPHYIAPEQARANDVGSLADVYSLACIMFEMLSGRTVFTGDGYAILLAEHMFVDAPRVRSVNPDVPAVVDDLIAQMLVKDPADRPSAREVHKQLVEILTGVTGTAKPRVARSRISRMVEAVKSPGAPALELPPAIIGFAAAASMSKLGTELRTAAAIAGLKVVDLGGDVTAATVTVALEFEATPARVAQLAASAPVLAVMPNDDLDAAMALLRAGAAEVVTADTPVATITSKISKLATKTLRKKG